MSMLTEIAEQPEAVARLLHANAGSMGTIEEMANGSSHLVVAARGTSDNAARYAQYVWGARNRLTVGLATPWLFGESAPSLAGAMVVGVSQSGQSPDLVAVMAEARIQGRPTLVVTNDTGSPLAAEADVVVDLCAGPERAVAATKTYTASLAAAALVSQALAGRGVGELETLPSLLAESLVAPLPDLEGLADSDRCVVVGRGFHLATVHEWALKLQELTYLLAQPFSAADFFHGPVAVVEEGFPVLAVTTGGPTHDEMTGLVADMRDRGAHLVVLTEDTGVSDDAAGSVPPVEPWLSPIVIAPLVQRFCHDLAVVRNLDPDAPRGLSKVTRTR